MALVGRLLEAHGFRVGILAQPDWRDAEAFRALGRPTVMWGVTAGNMDSMVNRYTSDRQLRPDDAYSPDGAGGLRPDRAVIVYAQRCREAFADVPVVIGGIEASLRRIAHYDYWSDKVRRSVLVDSRADLLVYGNAERAIVEIAHRLAAGEAPDEHHRPARHRVRAPGGRAARGLDRDRLDDARRARAGRAARDPYAMAARATARGRAPARPRRAPAPAPLVPRASLRPRGRSRAHGHPHARLRRGRGRSGAVRARVAHPARRVEPGQRARARPAPRRRATSGSTRRRCR